jgi:hypothetical protein
MSKLCEYLPPHLKHLKHSRLFEALDHSLMMFRANHIIDEKLVETLVIIVASEFEKTCDKQPVNGRTLQFPDSSRIANYRFDRGYWELVIPKSQVSVVDSRASSVIFRETNDISIEGSGGGLRKGKRKSESIKRAHTRQVAKDSRAVSSDEEDYDEDEDWTP